MLFIHNQQLPLNNVLLCFFASRSIGEFLVSSFCQGQEIHESLDIRQQAWCHQKMLIEAFDLRSIQINWLSLARCRKSRNFRGRRLCRWCCGPSTLLYYISQVIWVSKYIQHRNPNINIREIIWLGNQLLRTVPKDNIWHPIKFYPFVEEELISILSNFRWTVSTFWSTWI